MPNANQHYRAAMQNLVYPAVLGNVLFLTLSFLANGKMTAPDSYRISFVVVMMLYFGLSYLNNEVTPSSNYKICVFLIDIVEVALLFLAAYCLGLLPKGDSYQAPIWWGFCLSVAPIPVLELVWDRKTGLPYRFLNKAWKPIIATILLLIASLIAFLAVKNPDSHALRFVDRSLRGLLLFATIVVIAKWWFWVRQHPRAA